MSVLEMSHRSPVYDEIIKSAEALLREVAAKPDSPRAEEFARIYRPVLARYVARSRANHLPIQPADCDDIVQEALLAVLSALPGFKYDPARGRFRAYLQRTVRNAVMRFQRRRMEEANTRQDFDSEAGRSLTGQQPDGELAIQVWSLALARVFRSGRFSPNTMAAFRRVALEDVPVADVAREFKLKPNAVYQIRNRILRAVREELDRFGRGRLSAADLLEKLEEDDAEVGSLKSKV